MKVKLLKNILIIYTYFVWIVFVTHFPLPCDLHRALKIPILIMAASATIFSIFLRLKYGRQEYLTYGLSMIICMILTTAIVH